MKIIGHRGARGLAPENTLAAISYALNYHVAEVELDVRVTRDGIPILHHNPMITIGDTDILISKSTLTELLAYKSDLATLQDALSLISNKSIAHLEVKPNVPIKTIVLSINEYLTSGQHSSTNIVLASKSQRTLRELHQVLPKITKVVIDWSGVRASLRARELGTKRLSMKALWLWKGFLIPMHRRGYLISAYTMNDPTKVKKWQPYLYAVITDFPNLFLK